MATWEFQMTGLEITGQDDYGWPITQLVELSMQVKEDNVVRLHKTVWKIAGRQYPHCCAFFINSVERIDKPTNKDYGFVDRQATLSYVLNQIQQSELKMMKDEILLRVVGGRKRRGPMDLMLSDYNSFKFITDDMAWLSNHSHILRHDEAYKVIRALQDFYSRITQDEMAILCMNNDRLSHEDLEIVRSYRENILNEQEGRGQNGLHKNRA